MGARGPQPTPTSTLKLRGSWRAKTRQNEPQFAAGVPVCPKWITGEARREWRRILPQLEAAGLLTAADLAALAAYCDAWADFCEASAAVRKALAPKGCGFVEAIRRGLLSAKRAAREALLKAADRFGLSPATRSKCTADESQRPGVWSRDRTLDRFKLNRDDDFLRPEC